MIDGVYWDGLGGEVWVDGGRLTMVSGDFFGGE